MDLLKRRRPEPLDDLSIESPKYRPSEAMLADARRRANAPRSLTAWVLGDPPPGMSALDQKRAGQCGQPA
jgi:hypothetical protein